MSPSNVAHRKKVIRHFYHMYLTAISYLVPTMVTITKSDELIYYAITANVFTVIRGDVHKVNNNCKRTL